MPIVLYKKFNKHEYQNDLISFVYPLKKKDKRNDIQNTKITNHDSSIFFLFFLQNKSRKSHHVAVFLCKKNK